MAPLSDSISMNFKAEPATDKITPGCLRTTDFLLLYQVPESVVEEKNLYVLVYEIWWEQVLRECQARITVMK